MALYPNKLYYLLFWACIFGYIWLYLNTSSIISESKRYEVCLIKNVTSIPCPSCGTTRSVIALTKGNYIEAFNINPFGYLIALIMLIAPIWILSDTIKSTKSFIDFYLKIEKHLRRPKVAIPLVILVIVNWIWTITKGL